MSSKRPTQIPRWAWGAAATLVQPPSGAAEAGFPTRMEPPAQWFNWHFNQYGAWIDFLRGPQVEQWSRVQWPGTPASDHYNAPSALAFDIDRAAADAGAADAAFRMAVVGEIAGPSAKMFVSQRGAQWEARANLPAGVTGPFALKALSTSRWLLTALDSGGTPRIYYATGDNGAAAGPLGDNANTWTAATVPAGMDEVKALDELAGTNLFAATAGGGAYSADNGVNWLDSSFTSSPSGSAVHAVSTGVKYVWVSSDGEIFNSTDGATFVSTVTLGGGASAAWRLCAGAAGEVLAYRVGQSTVVDLYFSEDNGASWSTLSQGASAPKYITRVAYHDGVWVATASRSPWLWVSNDGVSWRALSPPVDTSASPAALHNVAWEGGAWVAIGNGFSLQCGRAADPATGADVASDAPATLSDAGSLRGARISTTAPTNGQVLAYNSTSGLYVPTTPSGSSSPTTTRGDLIVRGASADGRLALGASGRALVSDGTDPVWTALTASHVSGVVPTTRTIAGLDLSTDRSAAVLRAALVDGTTYTFASSTGVTTNNGTVGGSASVTGGVLRLTVPASPQARYVASNLEAPHADIAVPLDATGRRPLRWRARVRVVAIAAGTVAYILAVAASGSHRVGALAGPDGSGGAEDNVAVSSYGTFAAAALPVDGTGWLEVEVDGHFGIYRYGTGTTTTPPAAWTEIATAALPSAGAYTTLRLVGASYADPGTPSSVDFDDLSFEAL